MADGAQRNLAVLIALSLPPMLMFLLAFRRSQRSDENGSTASFFHRRDHNTRTRAPKSHPPRPRSRFEGVSTRVVTNRWWASIKSSLVPFASLRAPAILLSVVAANLRPTTAVAVCSRAGGMMTVRPHFSSSRPRQHVSAARSASVKRCVISCSMRQVPNLGR